MRSNEKKGPFFYSYFMILFLSALFWSTHSNNHNRAPRLDALPVTNANAIVGKNECDLSPIIGILGKVKKCIDQVKDDVNSVYEYVGENFFQTWTVLDVVQDKLCTLTVNVENIETKVCNIETNVDTLQNSVDTLDTKVDVVIAQVTSVDSDLQILMNKVDNLQGSFAQTWTILSFICEKIENLP